MYQTSQAVSDFIMGDARHFTAIMSFRNGTVLSEEICRLDLVRQTSSDDITPGDVISATLTGTLTGLSDTVQGQTFILSFLGVDYANNQSTYGYLHQYTYEYLHSYTYGAMPGSLPHEPIPMGEFKVSSCSKRGTLWQFEAHDLLYASDKLYTSGLTYPAQLSDVEHEICNALGISFRDNIEQVTIPYALEDVTYREMLGYIAGLFGKVCVVGRTGKLEYKGLTETGYVIEPDRAAEPDVSQTGIKITSLHCGAFAAMNASNRDITFENPYMTQAYFDAIINDWLGLEYTPLSVKHILGDPRLDPLDLVTVKRAEDNALFKVPLMSIALSWDGGLWSTLAATASTETAYTADRTNVRPITRQIKEASKETIDYISGAKGGYVITKFNEDGQPVAHYYTDNLDPEQATNIMLINQNGLAGTNGGLNGTWKTAITNDGRINASQILTGILKAITVQSTNFDEQNSTGSKLDLEDGTFSFAGGQLKFIEDEDNPGQYKLVVTNAEVVGGSFKVQTSQDAEDDNLIEFTSPTHSSTLRPTGLTIDTNLPQVSALWQTAILPGGIFLEKDGVAWFAAGNSNKELEINGDIILNGTSLKTYLQTHP